MLQVSLHTVAACELIWKSIKQQVRERCVTGSSAITNMLHDAACSPTLQVPGLWLLECIGGRQADLHYS